jgi:hypothetical protein
MRQGIEAIRQELTPANVQQLSSSINFSTVNFPVAQTLVREIDRVVSPTQLRQNIENVAQEVTQAVRTASSSLLDLRTRLARVNTV